MSRKLAREAAFKALFQLDFNSGEDEEREVYEDLAINTMFEDNPRLTKKDFSYIESSVKGARAHLEKIDALIISPVDRNILRLAVYEIKFAEPPIPKGIAINEAVELAKKYGTDDSGRFVNGILEAISK